MSEREVSKELIREKNVVRCLECFERIEVPPKAKEIRCPNCQTGYLIYWPAAQVAKIKGIIS